MPHPPPTLIFHVFGMGVLVVLFGALAFGWTSVMATAMNGNRAGAAFLTAVMDAGFGAVATVGLLLPRQFGLVEWIAQPVFAWKPSGDPLPLETALLTSALLLSAVILGEVCLIALRGWFLALPRLVRLCKARHASASAAPEAVD